MKIPENILFIAAILRPFTLIAQPSDQRVQNHSLGITFSSFGSNDVLRFKCLDGGGSSSGDGYFAIGIYYLTELNHWLDAETGIEYIRHKVILHPDFQPGIENPDRNAEITIINLPVTLRANFGKYFFANGGVLLDADASSKSDIDNQSGIDGLLGVRARYDFNCGASLFLNPYVKAHALVPFSFERYPQRTFESGIRFCAAFKL